MQNDEVCKIAAIYDAQVVIMHMQNNPENMQEEPFYENVILQIDEYLKNQISKANSFGIKDIVLDVGIGFGKTLEHNLTLLKNLNCGESRIRTCEGETNGFTVRPRWPLEYLPNLIFLLSRWRDSNPRPADYKSAALAN